MLRDVAVCAIIFVGLGHLKRKAQCRLHILGPKEGRRQRRGLGGVHNVVCILLRRHALGMIEQY